ncbi:MAG: hypothetical protein ACOYXN_00225 [Acidobacteriota bacterium]
MVRTPARWSLPARVLAVTGGTFLLAACAGAGRPRSAVGDSNEAHLSALRQVACVAVSSESAPIERHAASVLRREGGPAVVPRLGNVDLLEISLRCGGDLVDEGVMPNRPLCNGFGEEVLKMRLDSSEGSQPTCQGSLVLRREGRPIWWVKDWSPCRTERDIFGFVERLTARFAAEWKAAQKTDPPGS